MKKEAFGPLVGMRYRPPALTILQGLGQGQELKLRREPENEYDGNAIAVHLPEGWESVDPDLAKEAEEEAQARGSALPSSPMLGYVARDVAEVWAPVLDKALRENVPFPPVRLTFAATGSPLVTIEVESEEDGENVLEEEKEDLASEGWTEV